MRPVDFVHIRLAKCVFVIAANGGMPDTFWQTDSRIKLACETIGWTPEQARLWAEAQEDWTPQQPSAGSAAPSDAAFRLGQTT